MEALANFAKHTRQSEAECKDLSKLAQKWLAIHTTIAKAQLVYAHVASDYALVNMRTHNPPLTNYMRAGFDVDTFVFVLQNGLESNKPIAVDESMPSFAYFCETLFPKPVGEESWEAYERNDHWKKAAYFLSLSAAQYYPLVEAIYFADKPAAARLQRAEKDEVSDLYTHINRFATDKLKTVPPSPAEIGKIISLIHIEEPRVVVINSAPLPPVAAAYDEQQMECELAFLPVSSDANGSQQQWSAIRKDKFVQEYRKSAGLNATYPPQKIVKQMILSSLGFKGNEPVCASLLSQHQKEFAQVNPAAWSELMSAVTCFDSNPASLLDAKRPALIAYAPLASSLDPHVFLHNVLTLYYAARTEPISDRAKIRYLKAFPTVDENIINTLVKL